VESEIISFVGADYPTEVLHRLGELGIGTDHVARLPTNSIRLWILYEQDGRRQIHLQHDSPGLAPIEHIVTPAIAKLLSAGALPMAAHIAALPVQVQRTVARVLTAHDVPFTLDSLEAKGSVGGDLLDYLAGPDLAPRAFLPSRDEFALLFGDLGSPAFRAWSEATRTATLVIKDGASGSQVHSPPTGVGRQVPAYQASVLDPTGAGDAYCGGFAAGMSLGRDSLESAVMGTVAASFVVEGIGARALFEATEGDAQRRRDTLDLTQRR